jgi:cytoskeletal protein CcmA (bactofilin family)
MLRKDKKEETSDVSVHGPVSVEEKTIISDKISIEGSIQGKGDLVIDGSVKGSIELEEHHLTVGPHGQVDADIHADNVTIGGRMKGNINANCKVKITKDADFNGDIKTKGISVEDGAYLKATIEMEREPQKKTVSIEKPTDDKVSSLEKEPFTMTSKADKGN